MSGKSPHHRQDIEGMRGIAIVLVILAHAKVSGFEGGFVGVDAFFVLSGFLITGLLTREIASTGRVDFPGFYVRRLRRLLPALLAVLMTTGAVAACVLAPLDHATQADAAASAALWLSNVHFAATDLDYFGRAASSNLFLHTWSLSVEEQFYLVWPMLVLFVLRPRHGAVCDRDRRRLLLAFGVLGLASVAGCIYLTGTAPRMAFYMMPSRAWQFALGAVVAVTMQRSGQLKHDDIATRNVHAFRVLGWAGLISVLCSALAVDGVTPYPGYWALVPSMGTAAMLAAGAARDQYGIGTVLRHPLALGMGAVSYSWYLWHWPVLLIGDAVLAFRSPLERAALVASSLVLATLTYRCIESPLRHHPLFLRYRWTTVIGSLALMALTALAASAWSTASQHWTERDDQRHFRVVQHRAPALYRMGCDAWYAGADVKLCEFGNPAAAKVAVVLGDSAAAQWFAALVEAFTTSDWRLIVINRSNCPMLELPAEETHHLQRPAECQTWREGALTRLVQLKPDLVLISSYHSYHLSSSQWRTGTRAMLSRIAPTTAKVLVLRSTPTLPFNATDCLAGRAWRPALLNRFATCIAPLDETGGNDESRSIQDAAAGFLNVDVVDLTDIVCPSNQCRAEIDDLIVFRDTHHLSVEFVEARSTEISARLRLHLPSDGIP